jgi:molybdenum cofactor cytidylyltransferase
MPRLAAVILAAGSSSRYGRENKLLAHVGGRPVVRIVAEAVLGSDVEEVVVVTGCEQSEVEAALSGLDVGLVHNAHWQSGMGLSIAQGIGALGGDIEAAFVVPGDMPFLDAAMLQSLAVAFVLHGGQPVVYPTTPEGEQRNPVLWPRRHFAELRMLVGPEGAKRLLQGLGDESVAVAVGDASVFADIDTPADLNAAETRLNAALK